MPLKPTLLLPLLLLLTLSLKVPTHADPYDNVWMECHYITQCSMSEANATVASIPNTAPGYGAINDWRIGNGRADSVDCGTEGIGMVGLLYGIHRLEAAGRSNPELDAKARQALKAFFWSWLTNPKNQISGADGTGFPASASYDAFGNITAMSGASAAVTAQLLIAMCKYGQLSTSGDARLYQTKEFGLATEMGDYINSHTSSWTVDRSYAVAAIRALAHLAAANHQRASAEQYNKLADVISANLALAQDSGPYHNYFNYLSHHGTGVYNGGNVDQTGFAPYEFDARSPSEPYAEEVANWWDHGQAAGQFLTVQTGPYAGGVHQAVPQYADRAYPGDSFQLADAEWKVAQNRKDKSKLIARAWQHYHFALSPLGSQTGSGCWTNVTTIDGYIGGFVDWVDDHGNRPANWQRYVDTSAYMIIATEELVFSSEVDWSK